MSDHSSECKARIGELERVANQAAVECDMAKRDRDRYHVDVATRAAAAERAAIIEHGEKCLAAGFSVDEFLTDIESGAHLADRADGGSDE